ncbi:MAG TPA: GTP-sensing pleiotropic transcriptional regulator CodY [Firmicutes bacterium]|nr:GTP-sensing pleiotropic transcriptional regulator CodY [Bacillota bacterium]
MINSSILEKTRCINKILQNTEGQYVDYKEIADVLKNVIRANVYLVDYEGNILGYAVVDEFECEIMVEEVLKKGFFPKRYNDFLLRDDELRYNLKQKSHRCAFLYGADCLLTDKLVTVIPIIGGGKRLGTLLLARFGVPFNDEDLILAERGATVVGMEILREKAEEIEEETRHRAVTKLAVDTLSYSEMEAMQEVFRELDSNEGLLVASKIADQLGITRSVIVNALRKLESAGIVESRSLGMKGTHIKVLSPYLQEYLEK